MKENVFAEAYMEPRDLTKEKTQQWEPNEHGQQQKTKFEGEVDLSTESTTAKNKKLRRGRFIDRKHISKKQKFEGKVGLSTENTIAKNRIWRSGRFSNRKQIQGEDT